MCLSSTILLFYNLVKLSKSGDGLKGAIINLASNLNERVLLPRKDACKYISATIIGRKVNKTTFLKYPLYFANKEIQGLKSNMYILLYIFLFSRSKLRIVRTKIVRKCGSKM